MADLRKFERDVMNDLVGNERLPAAPGVHAERTNASWGIRESVEFLDTPLPLFACRHEPLKSPRAAIVICSSIAADFLANYHREVLVARTLAARGFVVQRFHYTGTGNSGGSPEDVTMATLQNDTLEVTRRLLLASGCKRVAFLATRWGALVAARAAAHYPHAPTALWEPIVEPTRFYRDAFRLLLMRDAKEGARSRSHGLTEELQKCDYVDILGYPLYRALVHSARDMTLLEELGHRPRPMLLVGFSPSGRPSQVLRSFTERLRSRSFEVDLVATPMEESWWFHDDRIREAEALLSLTTAWLEARLTVAVG